MIIYPALSKQSIGVTAPSSGVAPEIHNTLKQAIKRQEQRGFQVTVGETAWTQALAKSAPAEARAAELMEMLSDSSIDIVMPPWGGELLIEILEFMDFQKISAKWVVGYSDISVLLLAMTLKTGIATAHGLNFVDLRGPETDAVSAKWLEVLQTAAGESIEQEASQKFQLSWDHENPSPVVFHLTEETQWKTVSGETEHMEGRLLGGCIDVIRHLIGTPYGDVDTFRKEHIPGEPVIWYLENCEMNIADMKRSLTQMKYAGWFYGISGIVFGRSPANEPVNGYTAEKMYADLSEELGVPIIYDIDCGHVPPQLTFVNGAHAAIEAGGETGKMLMQFS